MAKTLLNDFYKVTELDDELFDDVKGDAETVAGLILELKGGFPRVNDIIHCKSVEFTVLGMDKRRIKEVKAYLKDPVNKYLRFRNDDPSSSIPYLFLLILTTVM